jgi:hypothetical protein
MSHDIAALPGSIAALVAELHAEHTRRPRPRLLAAYRADLFAAACAVHPDRGGTCEAFAQAWALYCVARGASAH